MSNEKMTSFSVVRKKTPFQKHREEEEAKKKRADEEAARLYEEFVESFKADDVPGGKAFVRGGTINPNERVKYSHGHAPNPSAPLPLLGAEDSIAKEKEITTSKKPGSRYVPSFIPPGLAAVVSRDRDPDKRSHQEEDKSKDVYGGKSRNIDHFMEELKREQEAREKRTQEREHRRDGRESRIAGTITADTTADNPPTRFDELPEDHDPNGKLPGSFDDGDPQTTNLYVGNLSPQVDENFLLRTFGRFGPIASVKIMWPRTEEERRRQRNCGFVAFMNRGEAQAAKDEMQGVIVYEYELRIGWGKAVALPAQALPAPPPGQMAVRPKEGATALHVSWSGPGVPPAPVVSGQNAEVVVTPNVPDIQVITPEDEHLRYIIDTMAMYVLDDGCAFEQAIMERGRSSTSFSFLFDLSLTEHTYYIWRLYSFAQGDTLQRWRTEPFIMITGSGRWIPPALPLQEVTKSPEKEKATGVTFAAGRGRRTDLERALTEGQRDEFEDMLRALTLERSQIREAMGFALDNSEAAGEVVEVLTESLTLLETPIPTKVARLMLVSDVLHNSNAPVKNASAYRTGFETRLPDIFESFNDLFRSVTGRITAEALKERVLKVLQVWTDWFLFSDAYVNGLRATFLRPGNSCVCPFHTLVGDGFPARENGGGSDKDYGNFMVEGSDVRQDAALAIGEGAAARELASLPSAELERRCRHNGLSIRGGRDVMVARLLSLEEAEKQKNHEPEEDLKFEEGYGPGKGVPVKDVEGRWSSSGGWTEVGSGWKKNREDTEVNVENGDGLRLNKMHALVLEGQPGLGVQWSQHEDNVDNNSLDGSRDSMPGEVSLKSVLLSSTPTSLTAEPKPFVTKTEKSDPFLPASKWTREDNGSDEDDKRKGLHLGYSSSESDEIFGNSAAVAMQESSVNNALSTANDTSRDAERRQKLRKLEVAVMEYRESLEDRGKKSSREIEQKVSLHRRKLEINLGLSEGPSSHERDWKGGDARSDKSLSQTERVSLERKVKRDERKESGFSNKRTRSQSGSRSPSRVRDWTSRGKDRERDREKDWTREKDKDSKRERDQENERGRDREETDRERAHGKREKDELRQRLKER